MRVTDKLRRSLRIQNTAFVLLLLAAVGLAAWLTTRYHAEADWTAGNRNTLTAASQKLLHQADGPITLTAYASDRSKLRDSIRRFADKYRRAQAADVRLVFVNPNAQPQRVRDLGIKRDGQLVVAYKGRTEKVDQRSEQAVANALQRLLRTEQRTVRFLAGHGERAIHGSGRSSLSRFARALKDSGIQVATLNLAETGKIPEATSALVIASPTQPLLDGEVKMLRDYVDGGGNLLWLTDKGPDKALKPLARDLGLDFQAGTVVDPSSRIFGLQDPTRVLATQYPRSGITRNFKAITLFPGASGLKADPPKPWQATAFLRTGARAWLESGAVQGEVCFQKDQGDRKGPITLGVALTRPKGDQAARAGKGNGPGAGGNQDKPPSQRVAVTTDSDFLTDGFVGSGGNRDLALNMVHWVTSDEAFVNVAPPSAPGTSLHLSPALAWALPVTFLFALPLALLLSGGLVWVRRRRL